MITPRILAFGGSLRRDSYNHKLAAIAAVGGREAGAEVTVISLREFALPVFDEDLQATSGMPAAAYRSSKLADPSLKTFRLPNQPSVTMNTTTAPDLTQRAPRSPRVRLGGYAMLPRVLDKARASLIGKAGDYKYGNPMDQHFFGFTGIGQDALLDQVKAGASDWDLLLWVNAHANPKRAPHEIRAWSAYLETMPLGDADDVEWFAAQVRRLNPVRTDLHTIIDYLDADDHVSFGGQA